MSINMCFLRLGNETIATIVIIVSMACLFGILNARKYKLALQ